MRCPSTKALVDGLGIDAKAANLIRRIAKATNSGDALAALIRRCCPKTQAYVNQMHSDPYDSHMWRVTVALHAISDLAGGYGVEGLGPGTGPDYAPPYEYINMGDPYVTTLIYRRRTDALRLGSWGDIAEKHPRW